MFLLMFCEDDGLSYILRGRPCRYSAGTMSWTKTSPFGPFAKTICVTDFVFEMVFLKGSLLSLPSSNQNPRPRSSQNQRLADCLLRIWIYQIHDPIYFISKLSRKIAKYLYQIHPDSRLKTIHGGYCRTLEEHITLHNLYTTFCQLQNAWLHYAN